MSGEYNFFSLKGQKLLKINNFDELKITTDQGKYQLFHSQDCCESTTLECIAPDFEPGIIVVAEEDVRDGDGGDEGSSTDSSFYLELDNGAKFYFNFTVSSNGHYSESIEMIKL